MTTPAPTLTVLRVLGVVLVTVAVLLGASRVATSFARSTTQESFSAQGVTALQLDADAAEVDVERGSGDEVTVDVTAEGTWRSPRVEHRQDGDTLRLSSSCRDAVPLTAVGFGRCAVSYRIEVPDGVDLDVRLRAGRLAADGVRGDVTARVNAGEVQLSDLHSSSVDVTADVGRVVADFAEAPDDVRLRTTTGAVEVVLPREGAPYAVQASAEVGGATIGVETDPSSPRSVVARTSVGAVEVRGR